MTKSRYHRRKRLIIGMHFQANVLTSKYPGSRIVSLGQKNMIWQGKLKPTPFSQSYLIQVKYALKNRPNVFVLEPELTEENIPHRFADDSLCLFRYKYRDWDYTMRIADTIIPWTSLWLYYYEQWLVNGEWLGGGDHPNGKEG